MTPDLERLKMLVGQCTPGPWKFDDAPGCRSIKGGKYGTHKQGQYTEIATTVGLSGDEKDRANAALIALTPTLARQVLALAEENARLRDGLKAAEEWLSGWASAEPYLETIRAALEGTPK